MRLLIAAGGTGGHIYPGIAVAQELLKRDSKNVVRFVGTERGLESKLVPSAGFELSAIRSSGLKNVGVLSLIRGTTVLPRSFMESHRIITRFSPTVVVGAGGYVSGPVLLTAALRRLPTLVMESNALPGFTNRLLARFIDRAAISFPESASFFKGKAIVTGNPVRSEFLHLKRIRKPAEAFTILVFGGSQGSRPINGAVTSALPYLKESHGRLRIIHQTGAEDNQKVRSQYESADWLEAADVRAYIDDMVDAFARADLIICRAGATTTAEIIAAGKAALMVPFPLAADNHQLKNARALEAAGAARVIEQSQLTGELLATEIQTLMGNPETIAAMERASSSLRRGDAAKAIVNIIYQLASGAELSAVDEPSSSKVSGRP